MQRLLSYASVAHLLDVSDDTVRRLVKKGLLPAPRVYNGVGKRFKEEDVLLYMARSTEASQEESSSRTATQSDANKPPAKE
jgi:excisionase family DNA binding protein